MWLVDLNVLIYATHADDPHHAPARDWLGHALSARGATVGLPWMVLIGFLRLSTHPTLRPNPLTNAEALGVVEGWLTRHNTRVISPRDGHVDALRRLADGIDQMGNLANDAHLAALAIEHRATLVSYDTDFARFPELLWRTPDQLLHDER